ncbi:hypothetical protein E6C27_scaffold274G006480 [Cucumis melo var. makuwa]|uniref:Uncharacterized protein n=2 Tax=Cucumis melo TaxID=3656 RepID=A0A5A7UT05_CUCMM|nr:hypothetical protein E6C27_scaffold274G006480 [Cucumis melo var. makuwa]
MGGKRAIHTSLKLPVPLGCSKPKKHSTNQRGMEKTITTVNKYEVVGGSSVEFSKRQKVKEFVDKNTGRLSSKEEVTYKCSMKVDDGAHGFVDEVQTQVKFKKVIPTSAKNNSSMKATNKHIMFDF